MSAPKHTPGPWEWSEDARELPEIFAPNGDALAEVYKAPGSNGARANARLIAAAPDMGDLLGDIADPVALQVLAEFDPALSKRVLAVLKKAGLR